MSDSFLAVCLGRSNLVTVITVVSSASTVPIPICHDSSVTDITSPNPQSYRVYQA
jgi:hypothetical protein